jgi:UDP-N-acetyl-D-mannosaminuronate dehydrogenase
MKIAVVGLGYMGLPLAIQCACSCVSVLGIGTVYHAAKRVHHSFSQAFLRYSSVKP